MALKICPDCKKEVSSRATVCPNCGCPAQFFDDLNTDQKEETHAQEIETGNVVSIEKEVPSAQFIIFNLCGCTFSYPVDMKEYAYMFGEYVKLSRSSVDALGKIYDSKSDFYEMLTNVSQAGQVIMEKVLEMTMGLFYRYNINLSDGDFLAKYNHKYNMDYPSYYASVVEKYSDILGLQEKMGQYRELQKASRLRWRGGGFGLKGAIKGAMTAGLLNFGSDFLHSFGDSERARKDEKAVSENLKNLRMASNTRIAMVNSIDTCIMNCFNAAMEELFSNGGLRKAILIDRKKADALFNNIMKYEQDSNTALKKYMECVALYPACHYEPIYDYLLLNEREEFERFVVFWNIKDFFPELNSLPRLSINFDLDNCGANVNNIMIAKCLARIQGDYDTYIADKLDIATAKAVRLSLSKLKILSEEEYEAEYNDYSASRYFVIPLVDKPSFERAENKVVAFFQRAFSNSFPCFSGYDFDFYNGNHEFKLINYGTDYYFDTINEQNKGAYFYLYILIAFVTEVVYNELLLQRDAGTPYCPHCGSKYLRQTMLGRWNCSICGNTMDNTGYIVTPTKELETVIKDYLNIILGRS